MAKKKEPSAERKIYKDFTLDEFDVMAMDMQCEGAEHERNSVIAELHRRRLQLLDISKSAGETQLKVEARHASEGLLIAINFIGALPKFEDRCGCPECGAL